MKGTCRYGERVVLCFNISIYTLFMTTLFLLSVFKKKNDNISNIGLKREHKEIKVEILPIFGVPGIHN